ncbi:MAG: hypothetical protein AABX33_01135 [Nanoarchaeota archaeon]
MGRIKLFSILIIAFNVFLIVNSYSVYASTNAIDLKTTVLKFPPNSRFDYRTFDYNTLNFDSNERIRYNEQDELVFFYNVVRSSQGATIPAKYKVEVEVPNGQLADLTNRIIDELACDYCSIPQSNKCPTSPRKVPSPQNNCPITNNIDIPTGPNEWKGELFTYVFKSEDQNGEWELNTTIYDRNSNEVIDYHKVKFDKRGGGFERQSLLDEPSSQGGRVDWPGPLAGVNTFPVLHFYIGNSEFVLNGYPYNQQGSWISSMPRETWRGYPSGPVPIYIDGNFNVFTNVFVNGRTTARLTGTLDRSSFVYRSNSGSRLLQTAPNPTQTRAPGSGYIQWPNPFDRNRYGALHFFMGNSEYILTDYPYNQQGIWIHSSPVQSWESFASTDCSFCQINGVRINRISVRVVNGVFTVYHHTFDRYGRAVVELFGTIDGIDFAFRPISATTPTTRTPTPPSTRTPTQTISTNQNLRSLSIPPRPGFIDLVRNSENIRLTSSYIPFHLHYLHFFVGEQEYIADVTRFASAGFIDPQGSEARSEIYRYSNGLRGSFSGNVVKRGENGYDVYDTSGTQVGVIGNKIGEIRQITQNNRFGYYFVRIIQRSIEEIRSNLVRDERGIVWDISGRQRTSGFTRQSVEHPIHNLFEPNPETDRILGRIYPDGAFIVYRRLGNQPYYVPADNEAGMAIDRTGRFTDYYISGRGEVFDSLTMQKIGRVMGDLLILSVTPEERINPNMLFNSYETSVEQIPIFTSVQSSNDRAPNDDLNQYIIRFVQQNIAEFFNTFRNTQVPLTRIEIQYGRNIGGFAPFNPSSGGTLIIKINPDMFPIATYDRFFTLYTIDHELMHFAARYWETLGAANDAQERIVRLESNHFNQLTDILSRKWTRERQVLEQLPEISISSNPGEDNAIRQRIQRLFQNDVTWQTLKDQENSFIERDRYLSLARAFYRSWIEVEADYGVVLMAVRRGWTENEFNSFVREPYIGHPGEGESIPILGSPHYLGMHNERLNAMIGFYRIVSENPDYYFSLNFADPEVRNQLFSTYTSQTPAGFMFADTRIRVEDVITTTAQLPPEQREVGITQQEAPNYEQTNAPDGSEFYPEGLPQEVYDSGEII